MNIKTKNYTFEIKIHSKKYIFKIKITPKNTFFVYKLFIVGIQIIFKSSQK